MIIKREWTPKINSLFRGILKVIVFLSKKFIATFYLIPAVFLRFFNIVFVRIYAHRVGHLTADMRIKVKENILNGSTKKIVAFHIEKEIANDHIVKYFEDYLIFVRNRIIGFLLLPFTWIFFLNLDGHKVSATTSTSQYSQIISSWDKRKPLFIINNKDIEVGNEFLEGIGFKKDDWFVCVHARDSKYSLEKSNSDFGQEFRNVSIESYIPAIEYIIQKGGKCIKMGHKRSEKLKEIDGLYDYSSFDGKNDQLDVFLFSQCSFSLCSDSGVIELSNLFGTPAAITNLAPMSNSLHGFSENICIPKLYVKDNKLVPFKTIMESDMSNFRYNSQFKISKINLQDNSEDEILELTKEMYLFVNGSLKMDSHEEKLYADFKNLFKEGHYMYKGNAQISKYFLKKYQNLI
tara:strand:- start:1919 stop:3133 length:1215 start_codon:yes stop_codon:yes gene_type:complete